jgi:predicted unusual protein kinase regulating ubiquinone biosynthesis (AarF/ABC1/UbiB family)
VHSVNTKDGRHLALKIQYPGIRESIENDVDNVASILRWSGLLPKDMDFQPLFDEAKRQLSQEADYRQEAAFMRRYKFLLADRPEYTLADVHDDLSNENILAMTYMGGVPIESLTHAPQAERDDVMRLLMELLFREIFEFHLVQTDPNFANYRYDRQHKQVILLDFGATRDYSVAIAQGYRQLMQGALQYNRELMDQGAAQIGFFQEKIRPEQRQAVLDLFAQACEPLRFKGAYDFGNTSLASRIRDMGMALSMEQGYWHTPPADALFFHRKLGGLYLLAAKLRAKVDVQSLFTAYLQ